MIDQKYDEELGQIKVYNLHETLLPFVGNNYERNRIIHIGESHYLSQSYDNEKFSAAYFLENWWDKPCTEVLENSPGYVDTRHVVEDNYLGGVSGAYGIFTNVIKSYSKIVLGNEIEHISKESKQIYNDFAFMNFFQMPSLYYGLKYWDSIYQSAIRLGDKNIANELWDKCTEVSGQTLDDVISILNPEIIMFTSLSAWNAYREYKRRQDVQIEDDSRYIGTSHPASPISWNKPLKSLNGKTGKETLEEKLMELKRKNQ